MQPNITERMTELRQRANQRRNAFSNQHTIRDANTENEFFNSIKPMIYEQITKENTCN